MAAPAAGAPTCERLREVYGVPLMAPHGESIAELVLTVLSQSTKDRNRDVAYERLRERFASWEAVMRAPVEEVEEAIRPGGISKVEVGPHPGDPARRSATTPRLRSTPCLDGLRDVPVARGRGPT